MTDLPSEPKRPFQIEPRRNVSWRKAGGAADPFRACSQYPATAATARPSTTAIAGTPRRIADGPAAAVTAPDAESPDSASRSNATSRVE